MQSEGWTGNSIVFTSRLSILGVDPELRQTLTKRSKDEFHTLNVEKQSDGQWVVPMSSTAGGSRLFRDPYRKEALP